MKKYLFLVLAVLTLCGCESWYNKNHLTWTLRPWGTSYYSYQDFGRQSADIKRLIADKQQEYMQLQDPQYAIGRKLILQKLAYANLLLEHSGLYDLEVIEGCSDTVDDKNFRNELLFKFNEDKELGFLPTLFGAKNENLADELAIITDNTVFSCNLQFKLKEFLAKYPKTSEYDELNNILKNNKILNFTLEELAETAEGKWGALVNLYPRKEDHEFEFLLSIPDTKNTLYPAICEQVINNKIGEAVEGNPDKLYVKLIRNLKSVVIRRDGYVLIYSSERAIENIVKDVKIGEYSSKLQKFGLEEKVRGNGFVYFNPASFNFAVSFFPNTLLTLQDDIEALNIICNQGDSILITQYSNLDFNDWFANKNILNLSKVLEYFVLPQIQQLELQKMNKAAAAKCVEDLKDIYQKYLLSFALQNQGKYPSKEAVANVIDSKKYCYIANRKNSEDKNMPLLFDCSNNHGNQINVLFVDGTVRSFEIENVNVPKKVISYLHSVYRYKAQTFAELLKLVK